MIAVPMISGLLAKARALCTERIAKSVISAGLCAPLFAYAQAQAVPDTLEQRLKACTSCHGKDGRAASDGYYPRIAGKPQGYLYNQLKNFRDGKRSYPLMSYMVGHLSDAYLNEIAAYFSAQHPPYSAPQASDATPAMLERGRVLVQQGDKLQKLPACVSCHGEKMTGVAPFIPGLLGLPRDYLVAQLGAWQTGSRHAAAPDCMQQIALKLQPQDIGAVSAWLAVQHTPAYVAPVSAAQLPHFKLPLSCGSVPE
ncbi:c-type cytochrome [Undibacterium piscinae]|uniref:C-type cytochrome n=1 Tax=Undibacterium piscinae TaxID=2495591 RepID=A0A6M4A6X1_9BURK|nr:c-type cytochrome [Undibacterium piscinae]